MGYTHYFKHQAVETLVWEKITTDVQKILNNLPAYSASSGGHYTNEPLKLSSDQSRTTPIISKTIIWFNGVGILGHEDFMLFKKGSKELCKTARKPYDLIVQACLLIYKYHSPNTMVLTSDGNSSDWKEAELLISRILGLNITYATRDLYKNKNKFPTLKKYQSTA